MGWLFVLMKDTVSDFTDGLWPAYTRNPRQSLRPFGIPHLPLVVDTVVAAPQNTQIAYDFTKDATYPAAEESVFEKYVLRTSGYPIASLSVDLPLCRYQSKVKEALDAWRANDIAWLNNISGCEVYRKGFQAELLRSHPDVIFETLSLRIIAPDHSKITLYGPGGLSKKFDWDWLAFF